MSNIFIHIGTHKTGTTTIQHALRQANREGNSTNWHFARTPRAAKKMMRASFHDLELVRSFRKDFLRALKHVGREDKTLIFSSEALSGWPDSGYQNSAYLASMLREATADHEVQVIIYLRRQDDFVESMYTQNIHQGDSVEFPDFLAGFQGPGPLMYSRIVNDFIENFDRQNIIVRSYHDATRKGLLKDFGELVGVAGLSKVESERKNPSYSRDALEIAKLSNSNLNTVQKRQLRLALQKVMSKAYGEQFSLFSKQEREAFLQRFADDNRQIVDRYLPDDVEIAFSAVSVHNTAPSESQMDHDQISRLVVELMSQAQPNRTHKGFRAGARIALAGYPRFMKIIKAFLGRT